MGAEQSEISHDDEWAAEHTECADCSVLIHVDYCTHLFKDNPGHKTYAFYEKAASRASMTVGSSTGVTAGVSKDGPSAGVSSTQSQSVTTSVGDYMVKMLRKDGDAHRCINCFHKEHPTEFKSVALFLKGKAWLINSDLTLNKASYGDIKDW